MEALVHPIEAVRQDVTAEELWERCAAGDERIELFDGEVVPMSPVNSVHSIIVGRLAGRLAAFALEQSLGEVIIEPGLILSRRPDLLLAPDLAFVRREALPVPTPERGFWEGAPDLAIEVVSPSDSASRLVRKVQGYLQAGVRLVWVIYPDERQVHVFGLELDVRIIREAGELDGGEVLPGFRLVLPLLWY